VTTREKQAGEREGIDYHYITEEQFQAIRESDGFVEFGQYQKILYGTTVEAVRDVIKQRKICVLNLHAEVRVKIGFSITQFVATIKHFLLFQQHLLLRCGSASLEKNFFKPISLPVLFSGPA